MILKGKKRGSVAPHREHVALPTIVLQLARIRVPHRGQANARRGFSSTIRVLDMNWEPYLLLKLRTSPIPQTVWCGHSLQRLSPAERADMLAKTAVSADERDDSASTKGRWRTPSNLKTKVGSRSGPIASSRNTSIVTSGEGGS